MPGKFCFRFVKTSPNYVQDPAIIALLIKQLEIQVADHKCPHLLYCIMLLVLVMMIWAWLIN